MKKYIITSFIALTAITSLYAEEGMDNEGKSMKVMQVNSRSEVGMSEPTSVKEMIIKEMGQPPFMITGDATIDAKIKALHIEMESKIKMIRDDYQAKIKILIGNKKLIPSKKDMMERGSSTMHMDDKKNMKGSSTMMIRHYGEMDNGTRTPEGSRPPMKDGYRIPATKVVKGESVEEGGVQVNMSSETNVGFRSFFDRFFGK